MNDFLEYWFESEKKVDKQIISLVDNLRKRGIKCYLVSDNEKRRTEYLWDNLNLKNHFDGAFSSSASGVTKSEKSFFQKILTKLSATPSEIIYWDDDLKNVKTGKAAGIESYFYKDFGEFIRRLDKVLPKVMKKVMAFNSDDFYCDLVFSKKIKVKIVKETKELLAFYHTRPSWSTHIVIVPKKHIAKLTDVKDMNLIKEIFSIAKEIIIENDWDNKNFKIISNGGTFQDSEHLHFHLVSGKKIR
ncbi:MAG: HAD-IA family hydrolase [Candidatus Shapirobacteria bacterium]